jgi:hypothetical protein
MVRVNQKTFQVCHSAATVVLYLFLGLATSHKASQSVAYSQALNLLKRHLYTISTE